MKLGYRLYIYVGYYFEFLIEQPHVSLIQNESYLQSSEKSKNKGEHKRQY